nr:MAG TPA: hypothetical protein [Bacteriophage sp.]
MRRQVLLSQWRTCHRLPGPKSLESINALPGRQ